MNFWFLIVDTRSEIYGSDLTECESCIYKNKWNCSADMTRAAKGL